MPGAQFVTGHFRALNFNSGWLGFFFNPFWLCRGELASALAPTVPRLTGTVLDFQRVSSNGLRYLLVPVLCTPVSILASLLAVILPVDQNSYPDNLVLARQRKNNTRTGRPRQPGVD